MLNLLSNKELGSEDLVVIRDLGVVRPLLSGIVEKGTLKKSMEWLVEKKTRVEIPWLGSVSVGNSWKLKEYLWDGDGNGIESNEVVLEHNAGYSGANRVWGVGFGSSLSGLGISWGPDGILLQLREMNEWEFMMRVMVAGVLGVKRLGYKDRKGDRSIGRLEEILWVFLSLWYGYPIHVVKLVVKGGDRMKEWDEFFSRLKRVYLYGIGEGEREYFKTTPASQVFAAKDLPGLFRWDEEEYKLNPVLDRWNTLIHMGTVYDNIQKLTWGDKYKYYKFGGYNITRINFPASGLQLVFAEEQLILMLQSKPIHFSGNIADLSLYQKQVKDAQFQGITAYELEKELELRYPKTTGDAVQAE